MRSIVLLIVNTRPFNISVPMGWAFLGLLIEAQPNGYIIQRDGNVGLTEICSMPTIGALDRYI